MSKKNIKSPAKKDDKKEITTKKTSPDKRVLPLLVTRGIILFPGVVEKIDFQRTFYAIFYKKLIIGFKNNS